MGGYTFGVIARRLTSEQLHALFQWAEPRIKPFTQFDIASPRTASDKVTHGDLDILMGNWCSGEGFKYNFAVEFPVDVDSSPSLDAEHWRGVGSDEAHQWSAEEVRSWAASVGRALNAQAWQNHQHGVSLVIPVSVLGDLITEPDEFFQVDLRMIRPDRFDFGVFIMSYGITALFMAQAVMSLSRAIIIHNEHCVIRHTAYPGLPVVRVELTESAPDLLDWLGLDHSRWKEGFATQQEFWRWISGIDHSSSESNRDPASQSLIQRAWTTFAATTGTVEKVHTRHQHPRFAEVERFRDWLRPRYLTVEKQAEVAAADELDRRQSPRGPCHHPTRFDVVTRVTVSVNPTTGELTKEAEDVRIEAASAQSLRQRAVAEPSLATPQPVPLDDFAIQALSHFGKLAEYAAAVAAQQADAMTLYTKQSRRSQNRQYAQDHEARAAKLRAEQGRK